MACSLIGDLSKVKEYLYIGPARAVTVDILRKHGITYVVNATVEVSNLHIRGIEFYQVPVNDNLSADLQPYFDEVADKIHTVQQSGGKTLVHCIAGASRSASLCIAYLMKYKNMTLREAFQFLKSRRKVIRPNSNFFSQLIEYEKKLFGKTTVKMVPIPNLKECLIPDIYMEESKGFVWLASVKNLLK